MQYTCFDFKPLDHQRFKKEARKQHLFESILEESFYKPDLAWIDECFSRIKQKYEKKTNAKLVTTTLFGKKKPTEHFEFLEVLFGEHQCYLNIVYNTGNYDFTGYDSIRGGGYSHAHNSYLVNISEDFLINFKLGNEDAFRKALISFKNTCLHENTHVQQFEQFKGCLKPVGDTDDDLYYNIKEAQAYARQYAFMLSEEQFGDREKILKTLVENPEEIDKWLESRFHKQTNSQFRKYLDIKKTKPKIWRAFLREIFDYF